MGGLSMAEDRVSILDAQQEWLVGVTKRNKNIALSLWAIYIGIPK